MPIVALIVGFIAVFVFARDYVNTKSPVVLGLALLTVMLILQLWTSWHNLHWSW